MAHAGQFGTHYLQVLHRLYHAVEWRYNDVKDKEGLKRETEILAKMLDHILADQVGHDLLLADAEEVLHEFQRIRHDSFTPKKYRHILELMKIHEDKIAEGYSPHLYGTILFEAKHIA